MDACPIGCFYRNRTLPGWQPWMLASWAASRNRTLPGWQGWMLAPSGAFIETGRYQVGSHGCSRHGMLLGTGRYQVGRDGCSPHRMFLETGRDQVKEPDVTRLAGTDARPPRCFYKPDVTRLAGMDARRIGCFEEPVRYQIGGRFQVGRDGYWQGWMLAPSDASRNRTLPGLGDARPSCSPHRLDGFWKLDVVMGRLAARPRRLDRGPPAPAACGPAARGRPRPAVAGPRRERARMRLLWCS